MWAKYGKEMGDASAIDDPKTRARPLVNVYAAADRTGLPNGSVTLDSLISRGVHFAVCQMATRRIAGVIAMARGVSIDAVYAELAANLVKNSHMVPAGIVAVSRAQERGYTFANGG
jgi:intracellular sulfur oxidation DsrE/DsrF family protein